MGKIKLKIYKDPDNKDTCIGEIFISNEKAQEWYKEVMRRFKEKDEFVFDVDESFECGVISIGHLQNMLDFFKKT